MRESLVDLRRAMRLGLGLGLGLFLMAAAQAETPANGVVKPDKRLQAQNSAIKGKFISTFEATDNPVCKLFTRNLNEVRHLSFNSCNPRLSPKYPEFSRP